mmetsp:Transcript_55156/g.154818  ORF Transcript_55156/g.154818 Transcript_55156/m.154818 type:complete len:206 (-) Transcript_55156:337-954(-)
MDLAWRRHTMASVLCHPGAHDLGVAQDLRLHPAQDHLRRVCQGRPRSIGWCPWRSIRRRAVLCLPMRLLGDALHHWSCHVRLLRHKRRLSAKRHGSGRRRHRCWPRLGRRAQHRLLWPCGPHKVLRHLWHSRRHAQRQGARRQQMRRHQLHASAGRWWRWREGRHGARCRRWVNETGHEPVVPLLGWLRRGGPCLHPARRRCRLR